MNQRIQWAIKRILEIVNEDFHGKITLSFQAGKLVKLQHEAGELPPCDP